MDIEQEIFEAIEYIDRSGFYPEAVKAIRTSLDENKQIKIKLSDLVNKLKNYRENGSYIAWDTVISYLKDEIITK